MLTRNEQILLILILFIFIYFTWKINNLDSKNIENYTDDNTTLESVNTNQEYINTLVKKIYLTDVEAIRILSNVAIQLSQGGIVIPNNINFSALILNDNIISSGNFSTNSNIIVGGNIDIINNVITKDITINGSIDAKNNIIAKKNITSNTIITNNINANKNITANIINSVGAITTTKNINVITGTGIIQCNELNSSKIGGGAGIGAWLINKGNSFFPIISSISDYTTLGINNINAMYSVMPGYKLEILFNNNILTTIDNTGLSLITSTENFKGNSCRLYYNKFRINDLYISTKTQY